MYLEGYFKGEAMRSFSAEIRLNDVFPGNGDSGFLPRWALHILCLGQCLTRGRRPACDMGTQFTQTCFSEYSFYLTLIYDRNINTIFQLLTLE